MTDLAVLQVKRERVLSELRDLNAEDADRPVLDAKYAELYRIDWQMVAVRRAAIEQRTETSQ